MSQNFKEDRPDLQTEVFDEADQAAMIQLNDIEQAMSEIRAKVAPETHPDFDGKNCVECGDAIPKARLKLGKVRCVYCQTELENHNRMYVKKRDE